LQQGEQYHIDVTADGFSHQYISRDFRQLEERTVEASTSVVLSSRLQIHLLLYDSETQESLGGEQRSLSIGQIHTIPLQRSGYRDTTLVLNTEREVLFSETEIDIPMTPKKSRHHIEVRDSRTGEPVPNPLIRMDGRVASRDTSLRLDRLIALQVSAPGYFFYDTLFSSGKSERPRFIPIPLQPIEKDFVLQLRAIQFNTDSYELTDDSDTELEQLLRLMQMNPTLRIELSSHTDDRGTDRYNDRLSTLRGESVARWLISRGIDAERIRAVGYGKRKPLVANDSDENRALNRRVEIKVVEY
jgi:outer membrane protein OmpA-like peptidoglycan-associated protein